MKRIFIFSFILISLFMSDPLSSKVIASSLPGGAGSGPELSRTGGASYSSLWKAELKLEEEGKPQSAYATVQTILQKAEAEGNQGQAMSARLRAAALHQEWAPDSFFTDVAELEALRKAERRPEAQAIYASVLAEIYDGNRQRSQAKGLALTSEDMKEWTSEQYDSAATENWRRSLADLPTLAATRSKDWLPFVAQAENSAYFKHDLLHILWQRVRDRRHRVWEQADSELSSLGSAVKDCYAKAGNRQAELLVALDLTDEQDDLLQLKEAFAELPLCTEVYLRLLQTEAADSQKIIWAKEALSRYPRYERIDEVRNQLNNLNRPIVTWTGNEVYYPYKEYTWKVTGKNATSAHFMIFRLKESFREEELVKGKVSVSDYIRKHGTLVQEMSHSITSAAPHETVEDSLTWKAPSHGFYAILYSASTDEKEAVRKTVSNQYKLFRVTSLKTMERFFQPNELEVITVDAETGQPIEGVTVTLSQDAASFNAASKVASQKSNAEGRAIFANLNNRQRRFLVHASLGDDRWAPESVAYGYGWNQKEAQENTVLHLYTDRAIYRPGQTVHLSGIVYRQKHWDAHVQANKSYELLMRDANWKEVGRQTAKADEMGVISADFVLPEGGLPGFYRIQTDGAVVNFRVEEYKRPTFEVTMEEAPALQWPQDSITLTGKAMGYNGVPIRGGRVTGSYQFSYPYFWWYRHDDSPRQAIDTVSTDEMGVFHVRVPLKEIPAEALRYGLILRFDAEVLSAAGETREGSIRVPLCTTALRLYITMQEQQDRERIAPPTFTLMTSTGKPTDGAIKWKIYPGDAPSDSSPVAVGTLDGGTAALCDALRALPSGDYELRATAQAGRDTASANARFYVFSMDDKRPPRHADKWLYCPCDSFDAQHPVRIQVGSSFENVALYYSLVGKDGVLQDQLIQLSNELRIFEIPYLPEYGDGVSLHFAFVKGGTCYLMNKALKHTLPDTQLRWQWTSFRDRLHSGDKETWTLRITKPDGTPAEANFMATIYDASLDQLTPHVWNLLIGRGHLLRSLPWRSQDFFQNGNATEYLSFAMKDYRVKDLAFDAIDETWLNGLRYFYGGLRRGGGRILGSNVKMMKASRASDVVMEDALADGAMVSMAAPQMAAVTANMEMAEEEAAPVEETQTEEGQTVGTPIAALRTNFNETAAFMPRLHSNPATGEVTLSFTLPESLTTWQLLGIAHNSDMMTANIQAQAVARKEMMAQLYLPRFLRAGDESSLRAVVQNLTDDALSGKVKLEVFDPETNKIIRQQTTSFEAAAQGEAVLSFDYTPAEEPSLVAVRLTAETPSFSDGEQRYLPILPSKEWITETVEVAADSLGTFTTDLSSLFNHNSPSATHRRLTIEYTTHPIWNVVQALPALREPQYDDVLSLTAALYANVLATHIANTTPRLKEIIELWKQQASSVVSKSPLANDEELKQLILDETPWLREADNDTERRAQLVSLFNENQLNTLTSTLLQKLNQRQESDGGFAWFPGMRSSEMMTRLVCIELTRLRALTDNYKTLQESAAQQTNAILKKAFTFIATENAKRIQQMKEAEAKGMTINTGSLMHLHYIYVAQRAGVKLTKAQEADVRYLLDHLKGSVASMANNERAYAAIVLKAAGRTREAKAYYDAMQEHLTVTDKHGTFFDYAGGSFAPTSHKILVHTSAMEAVEDLRDIEKPKHLNGLRRWLLQQKRTQMWESSICTADAIYALLHGNPAGLASTDKDKLTLNYARRKVSLPSTTAKADSPAALGYIRETFADAEAAPKSITVKRNNKGEAWGAVYAQYLSPISDATAHAAGLTIRREFSSTTPRLGDKLTMRYVITADRDYDYVCLRAERPASAEPAKQVSGYRYQGGLGYYCAVRDAHTDYFFDRLPKGTYVLEETTFIDRTGSYTSGICRVQCIYAPEYCANDKASLIKISQ